MPRRQLLTSLPAIMILLAGLATPLVVPSAPAAAAEQTAVPTFTEFSRSQLLPDGRIASDLYAAPAFSRAGGSWHAIDVTPRVTAAGISAETVAGPVVFGGPSSALVQMQAPGGLLTITSPDLHGAPRVTGADEVTFDDAAPQTTLKYHVSTNGVKEDILLAGPAAPHAFTFNIADPEGVITAVKGLAGGGVELRDDGDWRVVIPAPTVSSAGQPGQTAPVTMTWQQTSTGLTLRVVLSDTWAASQKYPIDIDPSAYYLSAAKQSLTAMSTWNCLSCDTDVLQVGFDGGWLQAGSALTGCQCQVVGNMFWYRSLLRFNMNDLPPGTTVQAADITLTSRGCGGTQTQCTSGVPIELYQPESDYWLQDGALVGNVTYQPTPLTTWTHPAYGMTTSYDVTGLAQGWVSSPDNNDGLLLRSAQEGNWNVVASYYGADADATSESAKMPVLHVTSQLNPGAGLEATGLVGPQICQDSESGCSRAYVDPADPLWMSQSDSTAQLVTAPSAGCPAGPTDCFTKQTGRDLGVVVDFTNVLDGDGSRLPETASLGLGLALGQPGAVANYQPCNNANDQYEGTCLTLHGYWYAKNQFADGHNNFSGGFFADNKPATTTYQRSCPSPCTHYWGQRVQRVDIEVWPRSAADPSKRDNTRVNIRWANTFKEWDVGCYLCTGVRRNRRGYANFGSVWLTRLGDAGTARMTGTVTRNGIPVGANEIRIRAFQAGSAANSHPTATSTGGHAVQGFSTPNTNSSGNYDLGAIYSGNYSVKVQDTKQPGNDHCWTISITHLNDFANFDVGRVDYGRAGYASC